MSSKSLFIILWVVYLSGLFIGTFIGYRNADRIGAERGVNETRTSAIEAGVGRYVITNEVTGATDWEWIKPIKPVKSVNNVGIGAITDILNLYLDIYENLD